MTDGSYATYGRKKRSVNATSRLDGTTEDELCNSIRLKRILKTNLRKNLAKSRESVVKALADDSFMVLCAMSPVSFSLGRHDEYCALERHGIFCQVAKFTV
ncbi:unnamed protein product, partial [Mesorhabditis spiculigera]